MKKSLTFKSNQGRQIAVRSPKQRHKYNAHSGCFSVFITNFELIFVHCLADVYLFKFSNRDTRKNVRSVQISERRQWSMTSFRCLYCWLWTHFTHFCSVLTVLLFSLLTLNSQMTDELNAGWLLLITVKYRLFKIFQTFPVSRKPWKVE